MALWTREVAEDIKRSKYVPVSEVELTGLADGVGWGVTMGKREALELSLSLTVYMDVGTIY